MLNINNRTPYNNMRNITFRGPLDGAITSTLRTLDTNPMANAVGIDLVSMVIPRTYVDTKERNKYAGAETFFREFTGTLIVCLSAAYFAKGISHLANKIFMPKIKINPNSWFSNDSINFLLQEWARTKKTKAYVNSVLDKISGKDGKITREFSKEAVKGIDFIDEKRWDNIIWDNKSFNNIHRNLTDKESVTDAIARLIDDKSITLKDRKNLSAIIELRLINILKSDKITAKNEKTIVSSTMTNLLRDMIDLGRDVFNNPSANPEDAINKILKINKIKSIGALAIASTLGLFNQYINRKITEKRTGTKGFVGDADYKNKIQNKLSSKDKSKLFIAEKIFAVIGMVAMALGVMRIKNPKDFIKKLEFTGPVTSGNAIKTVYASTLIGRFLASDNKDELRETVTRDYLGFLNWLVLGGFAAKGIANILDKNRENLFNISKEGKGLKYWLNDLSLKSQNEIASKGRDFARKNMWKLNAAQIGGLAYSTIALGILLPKLNILITNKKQKVKNNVPNSNNNSQLNFQARITMDNFIDK